MDQILLKTTMLIEPCYKVTGSVQHKLLRVIAITQLYNQLRGSIIRSTLNELCAMSLAWTKMGVQSLEVFTEFKSWNYNQTCYFNHKAFGSLTWPDPSLRTALIVGL